jgi:carboxyl-terminal processing protease
MTPTGRRIQGKGLDPDLTVAPLKLAKLGRGERLHEADLRGALRNTDPTAQTDKGAAAKPAPAASASAQIDAAGSIVTEEIGSADDEQLNEAIDVLRGLAVVTGRGG